MSPTRSDFSGCTIIARNQLAKARVLAESWHHHHPDAPFFVLVLDSPKGFFRPEIESFTVVRPAQLDIPNVEVFLFQYSFPEVVTAILPYFLSYLLEGSSVYAVYYLSAHTWIANSLHHVDELLLNSHMVLTPYFSRPVPDDLDGWPTEREILAFSPFCLDFLALKNSAVTHRLLRWWKDKIKEDRHSHPELDLSPERWFGLVPAIFDGVSILRQPAYQAGYWNYHELVSQIDLDASSSLEDRLHIFNFRDLDTLDPRDLYSGRSYNDFAIANSGALGELLLSYQRQLVSFGWETCSAWTYGNDFYSNGQRIPRAARRHHRSLNLNVGEYANPFNSFGDRRPGLPTALVASDSHANAPFGINVLGHLASEKGVGEMGRSNLRILQAAGINCVANDFVDHGAHNIEKRPSSYSVSNPYPVNLVSVNADCLGQYVHDNPSYLSHHFNIAYWAWELSEFPEEWATSFGYVDEVWTLSEFARDSIAASSPVPVHAVHCSLDTDYQPEVIYRREDFEIPEDTYVFLYFFDFHSYIERKNPIGLVQAFNKAFGLRKDVQLLIKSSHSRQHLDQLQMLQQAAAGANVRVLDEVLPRDAKQGLMMAADCYVSLHRSEGFGLTIAEAMLCGKPTIATDYSGNRDFMSPETNYPVPYKLVTLDRDHGPYRAGQQWAQPDLDFAADVMRSIERNRDKAIEVGRLAKEHVSQVLHPATIGKVVRRRLSELGFLPDVDAPADIHGSKS
jgi:glycosyltransferase involved in cell wall biosynthesis